MVCGGGRDGSHYGAELSSSRLRRDWLTVVCWQERYARCGQREAVWEMTRTQNIQKFIDENPGLTHHNPNHQQWLERRCHAHH
jgi:hypothetical protein